MNKPNNYIPIILPVQGMTCAHCVSHVETALRNLRGVANVTVDLGSNQASLKYDPGVVDVIEMQRAVQNAGYSLPTSEASLRIAGMHCMSCVANVEGALLDLPGVVEANASLLPQSAKVKYVVGMVTTAQLQEAVQDAGYQVNGGNHPVGQEGSSSGQTETGGLLAWIKKPFKRPNNPSI